MVENIIVIAVVVVIVGLAGFYVYKAKKSGKRCIGCPDGGSCSGCSCGEKNEETSACGSSCGSCCCGGKAEDR